MPAVAKQILIIVAGMAAYALLKSAMPAGVKARLAA